MGRVGGGATATSTPTYAELEGDIVESGEILGYHPVREHMERGYKLDVVWWAGRRSYEDYKNVVGCGKPLRTSYPLAMFEVQIKGSVDTALSRLKHAHDLWVCRLFPEVSERQARERAQDLLEALKGAFHEIKDQVEIIHAEEIARLAEDLKKHREILKKLIVGRGQR